MRDRTGRSAHLGLPLIVAIAALDLGCKPSGSLADAGPGPGRADARADEGPGTVPDAEPDWVDDDAGPDGGRQERLDAGPSVEGWERVGQRLPGVVFDAVSMPGGPTLAAVRVDFEFTETQLYELVDDRWVPVSLPFTDGRHAKAMDFLEEWNGRPIVAAVSVDNELMVYERRDARWELRFRRRVSRNGGVLRIRTAGDALLVHVNPWEISIPFQVRARNGGSEVFYVDGGEMVQLPVPPPACSSASVQGETFVLDEEGSPWASHQSVQCDGNRAYLTRWDGESWVDEWTSTTEQIDISTGYNAARGVVLAVRGMNFVEGPAELCEFGPSPARCLTYPLSDLACDLTAFHHPTTPLRALPDGRVFSGLIELCCDQPRADGLPGCSFAAGWAVHVDGHLVGLPSDEWLYAVVPEGSNAILAAIGDELFRLALP